MGAGAKRAAAVLLSILLVIVLAGCAKMDLSLKINADGSADWGLSMLLEDSAMSQAGADIWQNAKKELEAQGCVVTDLHSEGYTGISATRHFNKAEDLTAAGAGTDMFSGAAPAITVKISKSFFATRYDIHSSINPAKVAPPEFSGEQLRQVKLTMAVTLPAKALSHNATTVSADGLTYTWQLDPAGTNSIELSADVPNTGNMLLVGGGAAVLLIILVLLAAGARKRKKARIVQRAARGRGR